MIKTIDNDKEYFRIPASKKNSPTKSESGRSKDGCQSATGSPNTKNPSKVNAKTAHEGEALTGKVIGQSGVAAGNKKTSGKTVPINNDDNNRYVCFSDFWLLVINKLPHSVVDIFNLFRSLLISRRHAVDEEASLGALTQRLVSCLIEENTNGKDSDEDNNNKKKNSKTAKGKKVDANSAKNLEKRIRQELEEYQFLSQQDDIPYESEDDEILRELKSCQHELALIQTWNKESMLQLAKKAKKHLELEKTRETLKDANADVISAYVKLIQAKQRKRNPTKKEKDAAWKALKVQEAIYKKCEDLYLNNLSRHYNT